MAWIVLLFNICRPPRAQFREILNLNKKLPFGSFHRTFLLFLQFHMKQRKRSARSIQLGPADLDESVLLIKRASPRILLIDIHGEPGALQTLDMPDQPAPQSLFVKGRVDKQHFNVLAAHTDKAHRLLALVKRYPDLDFVQHSTADEVVVEKNIFFR
ncbi:hypothetical protein D1872_256460 [compost metagenome]